MCATAAHEDFMNCVSYCKEEMEVELFSKLL